MYRCPTRKANVLLGTMPAERDLSTPSNSSDKGLASAVAAHHLVALFHLVLRGMVPACSLHETWSLSQLA